MPVDFAQLRDADIPSVEKLVSPWGKAADHLTSAKQTATDQVGNQIRNGAWEGDAAATANNKVKFLEDQLTAGDTQATAIQSILKQAVTSFTGCQNRLQASINKVNEDDALEIDDSGHVSVKPITSGDVWTGVNIVTRYIQLQTTAYILNTEINDTIADARNIDGVVATKLRAAAKVDDQKGSDFNGDADGSVNLPDDGNIPGTLFDTALPDAMAWYSKLGGMAAGEPFADGTPQEQSEGIGSMIKYEVERAGGSCKLVDGLMVCVGAPDHMYERGGTTYGDTFISNSKGWDDFDSMSQHDKNELIAHEKYHRDEQWRKHGISFGRKYLEAELHARRGDYTNPYEISAEEEGGRTGYDIVYPPEPDPQPEPNPQPGPAPTPPG